MSLLADLNADKDGGAGAVSDGQAPSLPPRPVRLSPSLIRSGAAFRLVLAVALAVVSISAVALVTG